MSKYLAEFIGTMMLVILGDGVCCNVSLNKSGMKGGNSVHILIGWGLAVMLPAYCFGAVSGAHYNPAVTIGAAVRGAMPWSEVPGYIICQLLGGFVGAAILMVLYGDQIKATNDDATIRGCFCPSPSVRHTSLNFFSEFLATLFLVFTLAAIPGNAGESAVSWGLVYGVIVSMGASFGGLTGYAMNAARDTAPRLAYACFAPNKGHKDPDFAYGWIPLVAPILGGICGSLLYMALF